MEKERRRTSESAMERVVERARVSERDMQSERGRKREKENETKKPLLLPWAATGVPRS